MVLRNKTIDRRFRRFCETGDPDALGDVFDATAGRLMRVALWLARNRNDAEDLLQRTFLQAIETREQFRIGEPVLPWLIGLLGNQTRKLRSERDRTAASRGLVDKVDDPEVAVASRELAGAVKAVSNRLGEPYRDVLLLHLESGLNAKEIAARLDRPAGTVRTQLVRALELLRRRLPNGFVAGMVAITAPEVSALAGTREEIVRAAHAAVPASVASVAAAGLAVGGSIVAKKLAVAVSALALVGGITIWAMAAVRSDPVADSAGESTRLVTMSEPSRKEPTPHRQLARTPGDSGKTKSTDHQPETWSPNLIVVDESGQPVANAEVSIWAPRRVEPSPRGGRRYEGREKAARAELVTDTRGRARASVDFEACVVAANRADIGRSRELWLTAKGGTATLVLEPPIRLRGRVVDERGTPVAGASVEVKCVPHTGLYLNRGAPPTPPPGTVDRDGRFSIDVFRGANYTLSARLRERQSFRVRVSVDDREPLPVTLRFPGATKISGIVVDGYGRPVPRAKVTAWRILAPDDDHAEPERERALADADGTFEVIVRSHARYQLLAAADGYATSALAKTQTTPKEPHPKTQLVLREFASITGRLARADGRPLPGIKVIAKPESGEPSPRADIPNQEDLFPRVKTSVTDADGRFGLRVHPDTAWTISARLQPGNWRMAVHRRGVAPGTTNLLITVSDAESRGCVVAGRVRRRDGQPVGSLRVEVVDYDDDGKPVTSSRVPANVEGDTFTCPPLPINATFALRVHDEDDEATAPAILGPFETNRATLTLDCWLENWGLLPVRVFSADGTPALGVAVYLRRSTPSGSDHVVREPDLEGRVPVHRCIPGPHRLYVSRDSQTLVERDIEVQSGENMEVLVELPR